MAWHQRSMSSEVAAAIGLVDGADPTYGPGQTVIVCEDDETGRVAWVSAAPASDDPAGRANPNVDLTDYTGPVRGELPRVGWAAGEGPLLADALDAAQLTRRQVDLSHRRPPPSSPAPT